MGAPKDVFVDSRHGPSNSIVVELSMDDLGSKFLVKIVEKIYNTLLTAALGVKHILRRSSFLLPPYQWTDKSFQRCWHKIKVCRGAGGSLC